MTVEVEVYKNCTMVYIKDAKGHVVECHETRDILIRDCRRFTKIEAKTRRDSAKAARGN